MASSSYIQSRSYEADVRQCFDVLDEDRTGTITPHALTTLLRSMGHRVTRDDVMAELTAARERRRRRRRQRITAVVTDDDDDDDDEYIGSSCDADQIDVELVLDILAQERYVIGGTGCSSSAKVADLQDTFRLFDVDNKGIITVENLKKVAMDIHAGGGSGTTDIGGGGSSSGMIDDDLLQSMIETFDGNLTGGINFEQFCRIMGGQA